MVATSEQEQKWIAEFEMIGETAIRNSLQFNGGVGVGIADEPKRQCAFRWLRKKEEDRERREHSAQWYAKWTFWAAVAAVLIGIVGILVTISSGH
jgi:hypothetical protein